MIASPAPSRSANLDASSPVPSEATLRRLFPRAASGVLEAMQSKGPALLAEAGISDSPQRLAYFLAQLAHESAGMRRLEESLSYSARRLIQVWPSRFPTEAAAAPYARNPEKLANNVYANRLGNGDEASGDGWRYRGRGLIQITGKANYADMGARIGVDLVSQPDRASDPLTALTVAVAYWQARDLNRFADRGDFTGLTRAINGGTIGLADRRRWLSRVESAISRDQPSPHSVLPHRPTRAPHLPSPSHLLGAMARMSG